MKKYSSMSNRVLLVYHYDAPPDDRVHSFLVTHGFEPVIRRPFAGEVLERANEQIAGAVIYGGSFPVHEMKTNPFLKAEDRLIGECLEWNIPLLGICQGAQQMALHLGATVEPHESGIMEFGYYEISPTPNAGDFLTRPLTVAQDHGHTFSLPAGATHLASSSAFENQAFRYGRNAYALQFHPEVTIENFRHWQSASSSRYGRPGTQTREEQEALMYRHDAAQANWFYGFLGKFFEREGISSPKWWYSDVERAERVIPTAEVALC
ncbi:GMP synthase (glutamine-hydrolyzing) [Rhizobium mesoamericanum]|uniref:glutamine amidotransferase-related protein n=1 Tax=Rhizobium mesoamericanum TaxID=1079800 RepID=UPI00278AFF3D|nr:gamma-glutamyl-gamma-aminobutyrate hydrolase family protein [Rhizobium mesoamericanum]MDQ0564359.1 GMP synthase (glutamine-hydrolyzing) [Rhizobium mesoamericanum]